ncbi:MAG: hypothetical protein ACO1RT_10680 [Planctomycetaceae bacterium]
MAIDKSQTAPTRESPASMMPVERSRAMPRLSFRFLMTVVTLGAIVALTWRNALAGSALAVAVLYSLATLAMGFVTFAALFVIAWIPAVIGRDRLEDVRLGNPFSADQLPPQVLPPRDPGP